MRFLSSMPILTVMVVLHTPAVAFDCEGVPVAVGENITLELVSSALNRPVDVVAPPGDTDRLFIVEQPGLIRILDINTDTFYPESFLDIRGKTLCSTCSGELGLLGLAFHPDYESNGYFFVNYNRASGSVCQANPPPGCAGSSRAETVVARYRVSDDPDRADAAFEDVLLVFCQPFRNHNGGQVAFGPNDGYLYISTGDGGSAEDPCGSGQTMSSFLGKMLRIDVGVGDPYAIPVDNPYGDTAGARPEIWALGLRNPWRFGFDPGDPVTGDGRGDLYVADVGQGVWEEIDYQPAASAGGENYEWSRREGDHDFNLGVAFGPGDIVGPIYEYHHSLVVLGRSPGRSVTGGVVYRGCGMPDLHGRYFFADYSTDWVKSFRVDASGGVIDLADHTTELNAGISPDRVDEISAFGVDGRGELYICDLPTNFDPVSSLFRVVPAGPPNTPPTARIETDPDPAVLDLTGASVEITLDGSGSDDGDGGTQGLTFSWKKLEEPSADTVVTPTASSTVVVFTGAGEYTYELTVDDSHDTDTATVTVTVGGSFAFIRGDSNVDGQVDISDGVRTLVFLFLDPSLVLDCFDAADTNDSGEVDLSDASYTFNYLFLGGPLIPGPTLCGADPGVYDGLNCRNYDPCE